MAGAAAGAVGPLSWAAELGRVGAERDQAVADSVALHFAQAEALVAAHPHFATLFTSGLGHHRVLRDDEVLDAIGEFVSTPTMAPSRAI